MGIFFKSILLSLIHQLKLVNQSVLSRIVMNVLSFTVELKVQLSEFSLTKFLAKLYTFRCFQHFSLKGMMKSQHLKRDHRFLPVRLSGVSTVSYRCDGDVVS